MNDTNWLLVIGVVLAGVILILLRPGPAVPPSVDAGSDIVVTECDRVRLTCDAIDPNGDRLIYTWTAEVGTFNDPHVLHPIYTAPPVCCGGESVVLTLTATNEHGLSASDSLTAYVRDVPAPPVPAYCPPPPQSPVVDAGPDIAVNECATIPLTCKAIDPNGNRLTYTWTAEAGTFNDPHVLHPIYTAPPVCCGGETVVLTLTATNEHGLSSSDSLIAYVRDVPPPPAPVYCPPPPQPPVVDAGPDITITECGTIPLTCTAIDPNGDRLTYTWTAEAGTFNHPHVLHPIYTAPPVCCGGETVVLTLTATNEQGLSSSDSLNVYVRDVPPSPVCPPPAVAPNPCPPPPPVCPPAQPMPVCPPTTSPGVKSLNEGESIHLHGNVYDCDNNVVSYRWTADMGTFDDLTSLNPVYTAPMVTECMGRDVCITLTATDSCGAIGIDRLVLHINNVNHPPRADAGEDLAVPACGSVQLTCTASDPDGDPLTYRWEISSGGGSFDNPYVLHPVYTAPSLNCGTLAEVVLTLTVTDACGASSSDSIVLRVTTGNAPPVVSADP